MLNGWQKKRLHCLNKSTVVTNVYLGQMDLLVILTRHNKVVMEKHWGS